MGFHHRYVYISFLQKDSIIKQVFAIFVCYFPEFYVLDLTIRFYGGVKRINNL